MQTLKEGSELRQGSYRIEKVLGQGGFGITYLATDINLQRFVAIKEFFAKEYCDRDDTTSHVTLGTEHTADFVNRLKAKFLKEARNIAKLDHPGIIRIFAAFEENNTAYYVMEYIEGVSLSQMVKKDGPLTEAKAVHYIKEVGEALKYVHSHKINHLDVKPANIMVRNNDDTTVLIDFGLSKQYDAEGHQTSTTPTGISHGFAPLEQYNTCGVKTFSPQTDVYSLAATLYYLLTGVVPPQATRLIDEELTLPVSVPNRLVNPILKAMSSGRKHRYPDIALFIEEIDSREKSETAGETDGQNLEISDGLNKSVLSTGEECFDTVTDLTSVDYSMSDAESEARKASKKKWIYILAGLLIIFVGVASCFYFGKGGKEYVTDMIWESPLGISTYTGEVVPDTLDNGAVRMLPHGKGVAVIGQGVYTGAVYDGHFEAGVMDGETVYTLSNGDVFKGKFRNNQYHLGRYEDKASGEYFEGSFKDMAPLTGTWYSEDGEVIEKL